MASLHGGQNCEISAPEHCICENSHWIISHKKKKWTPISLCCFFNWYLTSRLSNMKEMLCKVRYLKSSEDMILALAGQFFRFMRQLLKLSSKCEDHIFTRLSNVCQ